LTKLTWQNIFARGVGNKLASWGYKSRASVT